MQKNPIRLKGGDETRRYAMIVAKAYEDAPDFDPSAVPAYQALGRSLPKLFRMVQSKVDVEFVDGQPYRDDAHLVREVKRTGKLLISRDFNEHPVFTPEQNLQLRAVHDWFAHIAPSAEFSQRGELKAYNAQAKLTPRDALPALFTEVVGQAMYATVHGQFAPQKIAILEGFDYVQVGRGPAVEKALAGGVRGVPEADPTAAYWGEPAKNPASGFLDRFRRKQKQTFKEACYQRKPPGLRPRQTVVVDNEGRYFLVSENTPEHQRTAGYREVLVFPCDSAGKPYSWSEVGGRRNVDFSTFLTDLLEGREELHDVQFGEDSVKNPSHDTPERAYNVVAPDGTVVSSWDYREDATKDLRDNKAVYPAGCRILTERGLLRFRAHLAGDMEALNRNPGGAKQRARGTRTVSPAKHHTPSWQQHHERYMQSAAASRRAAAAQPEFDHHGEQPRDAHIMRADEHRFAAKQIRERSRPYAFQLRSESGVNESFQSHAEALAWAESNLKKGEFFTISKDSDHFHEHYVKE